jgi:predicted amidohydrolase YtcJ
MIEKAMQDDPSLTLEYVRSRRFSADHCGWYPRQDQLERMARLNIHLSCASKEIDDQGAFIPKIFGEQYANRIGPINSILKSGMIVANEGNFSGTDEVENTTFARFYPFMTRMRSDGVVLAPEERINRVQLLKMSTSYAAAYVLKDKELGTLEPGKLADFVVLSKDYFTIPEEEIPSVYPLMTVVGGKTIVLRDELARDIGQAAVGPQIEFSFEVPKTDGSNEWVPEEDYFNQE